jgi:hypothetical protein
LDDLVVFTLAIDPLTPTTLYAGSPGTGVFKSTNGGQSWSAINTGLGLLDVRALAIDPLTPTTLYASSPSKGVFKSTNGGQSWSAINTGLGSFYVHALAIDPLTPTTLYAGTFSRGVFKSTNGGQSWSNTGLDNIEVRALTIDPLTPTTLYAGTSFGAFKSTNGGADWSTILSTVQVLTPLPGLRLLNVGALAIDPLTPTTLYAGTFSDGVFKSTNGGQSWSAINTGLDDLVVFTLAIDPQTPTTLYAGTGGGVFDIEQSGSGTLLPQPTMTPAVEIFPVPPRLFMDLPQFLQDHGNEFSTNTRDFLIDGVNRLIPLLNRGIKTVADAGANGIERAATGISWITGLTTFFTAPTLEEKLAGVLPPLLTDYIPLDPDGRQKFFVRSLGATKALYDAVLGPAPFNQILGLVNLNVYIYRDLLAPELRQLAADPFDPNYQFIVSVGFPFSLAVPATGNAQLDSLFVQLQEATLQAVIFLHAANISFDRYSSALASGDSLSAGLQLEAILHYLSLYDTAAIASATLLTELKEILSQLGVQDAIYDPATMRTLQADVVAFGFPDVITDYLLEVGLTAEQIDALKQSLLNLNPDEFSGSLFASIADLSSAVLQVSTAAPNEPPTADAGPDQTVPVRSMVTLDGSGSSDPDNGPAPLSFIWSQTAGPAVTLTGADTATPTFTPTVAGSYYTFSLIVNDGQADSAPDSVTIHVRAAKVASLLSNGGFEDNPAHSQWIATKPNKIYNTKAPVVNPVIAPKGKTDSLQAPAGSNFVGILNPKDQDMSGKLVHTAVAGSSPKGTVFEVTVFANRGRLAGAKTALFDTSPSEVLVQFFGWGAGSLPTINPNTDNWSRRPGVVQRQVFTNWAANGEWASQTFQFVTDRNLSYISLSIAGMNHKNASYVAFDVE